MNRLVRRMALAAAMLLAQAWLPDALAQQAVQLTPNIRALPAVNLSVVKNIATGIPELRFAATTWNAGAGPLVLAAGETGAGKQNVYQRLYKSDGTYTEVLAGSFIWHPDHNHFHFEDFALYSLQLAGSPGHSARTSSKTTFCVMDTTKVDGNLPGAPSKAVYASCGNLIQGMSVGWGDTYGAGLPGQAIDLSDWAAGDYKLTIVADPVNRLIETDESDNSACLLVHIDTIALTVAPVNGASCDGGGSSTASVASITPSSASVGSRLGVTIAGSGFIPGMSVSFVNGSGAKPSASNVVVQSSQTITAVVTVKKGSTGGDMLWDLQVGNAILQNAFTVLP